MEELKNLVKELQTVRKNPVLVFYADIDHRSVEILRTELKKIADKNHNKLDVILDSPGGIPSDSYRILRLLRKNFKEVNIIIPFWAKSAATLLSLGGSTIIMDKMAELGPIDMQITKERKDSTQKETNSALNDENSLERIETRSQDLFVNTYTRLVSVENLNTSKKEIMDSIFQYVSNFYKPLLDKIDPYEIGYKSRALDVGETYAARILLTYGIGLGLKSPSLLNKFLDFLRNRCPEHGYIIDVDFMKMFFDNVLEASEISESFAEILDRISIQAMTTEIKRPQIFFIYEEKKNDKNKPKTSSTKSKKE